MGETGFPTRVLSTAWGGMFTYAAPNASEGTASGQVSARVLRHLYRAEKFSRAAKIYGVIADPVRHSISPAVHNRAFQAHRIDAVYLPFLVQPAQLKDFFILAESLPIAGFSVTIPHKQKIIRYLDVIDPLARRIGAVNTVWRKAGQVARRQYRCRCRHHSVVAEAAAFEIVGAGGGQWRSRPQRGVCAGRQRRESFHRRPQSGSRAIAGPRLRRRIPAARTDERRASSTRWSTPRRSGCCLTRNPAFFDDAIPAELVFDMVYNPLETTLLRHAATQGSTVISGLQMFLEQASRQFEIWTGAAAPRSVMEKAAIEALAPACC